MLPRQTKRTEGAEALLDAMAKRALMQLHTKETLQLTRKQNQQCTGV